MIGCPGPLRRLSERAGQWGGPLHAVRSFPQAGAGVDSARGGVCVAGGSVGDPLMLLVFCVHGVSGEDTTHHVPGISGQRRAARRRVYSRARWQRRL